MRGRAVAVAALDTAAAAVPYHFRCPISLELMSDPVTVSTGQTYDRDSIEAWVAAGNFTCPVTRSHLDHASSPTLIPNHTLRRLIQEWCTANRHLGFDRIPTPKQPPDRPVLLSLLSSCTSPASRLASLRRLRCYARDSDRARSILADVGAHSVLFAIIFSGDRDDVDEDEDEPAVLEALGLITLLLPLPDLVQISDTDGLVRIVRFLGHPTPDARANAAALLDGVIAAASPPDRLRLLAGECSGVFDRLVELVRYPRTSRPAVRVLFSLALARPNRAKAVEAGAGEALLARLGEMERCEAERALATVELLCRGGGGGGLGDGGVAALVRSMTKVSERATEYAAGALAAVCTASEEARRAAVGAGVVAQLLLVVQSGCTDRAKRKAQLLLKLLPTSWPHFSFSDNFGPSNVGPTF